MTLILIATNLITLALLLAAVATARRDVRAERARGDELLRAARSREDQLLNRIQAPSAASAQSMTEQVGPLEPAHISAFDDGALAEYEQNRRKLEVDTRALIEEYEAGVGAEKAAA